MRDVVSLIWLALIGLFDREHRCKRRDTPELNTPDRRSGDWYCGNRRTMNEVHQLATAMLAIAFAAVMLVAGQLFIENRSARLPAAPAALMASVQ